MGAERLVVLCEPAKRLLDEPWGLFDEFTIELGDPEDDEACLR